MNWQPILLHTIWLLIFLSFFLVVLNFLLAIILRSCAAVNGNQAATIAPVKSLSIIIPAYNEESTIGGKIESVWRALQQIDIDAEVIIGSDGSTDRTLEVATCHLEQHASLNWKLLNFQNEGKCKTINKLVAAAAGEIIVSTDADIEVPVNALAEVVQAFRLNGNLGCLSCIPVFNSKKVGSQKSYWKLEEKIRAAESSLGKLIVVSGWFFAFRKQHFDEIPAGVMADDLWIPLTFLLNGFDCAQLASLRVHSEVTDEATEIKRRNRVMVGGMDVIRRLWPRLVRNPTVLTLVLAHKVNRWALPLWLSVFLLASAVMAPVILIGYLLAAGLALWLLGSSRFRLMVQAGFSPICSFFEVLRKDDFARWEHTRKD